MSLPQRKAPPLDRPTLYDRTALEAFRKAYRLDPEQIRRLCYGLFQMYEPEEVALSRLGLEAAQGLARDLDLQPVTICETYISAVDGSNKLVLQGRDREPFETVILHAHTGRTTVCVSTQSGCGAGCPFCATSRMGWRRNLRAAEILEQVRLAGKRARQVGRRLRNVVFMGMGEPLDNEQELWEVLEFLQRREGFGFSPRRLMVSSVGIPPAMIRLADRFPRVQFALSLHSARPELRARLVPWSRRHTWDELHQALRYVAQHHRRGPRQGPVMIEYLMLHDVNDGWEDAQALIDYLSGIPAMVNLIPFNPIPDAVPWVTTPRPLRKRFAEWLRSAGIFTTVRYSMGQDIRAACGQLVRGRAATD